MRGPSSVRRLVPAALFVLLPACAGTAPDMLHEARLVHDVFFSLKDPTPAACQQLVDDCYGMLAGIDGVLHLAAGTRDRELVREVNDQGYDVSLHVWFSSRAAHDAYQTAPDHLAFVTKNKDGWAKVRVFDSTLAAR